MASLRNGVSGSFTKMPADLIDCVWVGVLGGFLFGMGAALNKGCAFSTLSRLGDGQLAMLVTLAGFCSGIYVTIQLPDEYTSPHTVLLEPALTTSNTWTIGLVGALWIWVMWEGSRQWRSRRENTPWWQLVGAHRYRLSTAAAVLGIASGILYALHGAWAYSGTNSGSAGKDHADAESARC